MTAESERGHAGRVVSPEEAARLGLPQLGPEELAVARDAGESFFASILNLGALMRRPLNATSLRTELSLADRLTLLRVAELLEAHGLQARVLRGDLGLLSRQERPAALVVGGRLCVLLEVSRGCAYLLDPARGTVALSRRELAGAWDGALLEVQPLRMDAAAGPASFRASVLGLVLRYRPSLLTLFGLSLGGFALSLVAPRFSQAILDQALRMKDPGTLAACAAGLAIATLFSVGATLARQWVLSELTFRLDFRFSAELYRHALSLPARFFSGRRAGSMLARL
ncbi:MAG TPA: ABC transporter transmembrane domain-containing protein, partial [Myxococcales bacterium]|nr:ABC transporter transmembrane domain-containing protein [Myxococcales bacterium]